MWLKIILNKLLKITSPANIGFPDFVWLPEITQVLLPLTKLGPGFSISYNEELKLRSDFYYGWRFCFLRSSRILNLNGYSF